MLSIDLETADKTFTFPLSEPQGTSTMGSWQKYLENAGVIFINGKKTHSVPTRREARSGVAYGNPLFYGSFLAWMLASLVSVQRRAHYSKFTFDHLINVVKGGYK